MNVVASMDNILILIMTIVYNFGFQRIQRIQRIPIRFEAQNNANTFIQKHSEHGPNFSYSIEIDGRLSLSLSETNNSTYKKKNPKNQTSMCLNNKSQPEITNLNTFSGKIHSALFRLSGVCVCAICALCCTVQYTMKSKRCS